VVRDFQEDEPLYLEGDTPNGVFGLVSGSLNLSIPRSDGEDFVFHRAQVGFWVGDLALFADATRLVSIRAAEPSRLVHLPAERILQLVDRHPGLHRDFYRLTYENFRFAIRVIGELTVPSSDHKVALRLLLDNESAKSNNGWITMSQSELAERIGVSLPTIQRTLRRLVDANLIEVGYRRIRVVDSKGLLAICDT
jgi:CRP-like cAMP-binding protein